ncbi:S8 family serine peptidase [Oceanobacillus luteolus]|uniref:S8 family serine peptidase n=1 Tax=Oceanobacillus luteolus TaxID=1274358 RepID=A0ABW4HTU7_9BACI
MGNKKLIKLFSSFLAFLMVVSLVFPVSASRTNVETFKEQVFNEENMELKAAIVEQLENSEGLTKLHKDLQGKSGNEMVPVIIHLSEKPVALEKGIQSLKGKVLSNSKIDAIRDKINKQHGRVDREMVLKGITFDKGFSYDTVLNGFAAEVKADDLVKLLDIAEITLVEPDTIVYATDEKGSGDEPSDLQKDIEFETQMDTSIPHLGIEAVWEEGYKGAGIKVAVLDTGIDPDHPEFQGIYKGGKNFIVHSSDYSRERADDDARETSPAERPDHMPEVNASGRTFWTDHGTHVAGTIAAIGANEYGIQGVAPEIDLYAYRVLGAYGSGATSGIISAVEHAVNEEMDIINLSLGGGSNSENDSLAYALNNAMMADVVAVVSSGNSGPNRATVTTPGTSRLGITVGNTTNPETQHSAVVSVSVPSNDYGYSKELKFMGTTYGQDLAEQLDGEYELVSIPGFGSLADYEGIDVEGKVALISRGELPFVDKIANAKENGAVATIIHNFSGGTNAPDVSDVFLGDTFSFIPTIDMSVTDGEAIRSALEVGPGTVSFAEFGSTRTEGDEINSSSSRGPSTPNFDIKPDVLAPGTNIMSSIPAYKWDFPDASYEESYDRFTGTSMAAPHIAGIAALVKQANPDWDAFDVKVALSNTATLLDTERYDVFAQGPGRVDPFAAAFPSVLAYAEDEAVLDASGEIVPNIKGTVTFGPQDLSDEISVTKQIRVKDLEGIGGDFSVEVEETKPFSDAYLSIDKESFTLAPDGEEVINVTLVAGGQDTQAGDEFLGYIRINGGENHISLPFAADFSPEEDVVYEVRDMSISETDLSFNGDGVNDQARLDFTITGDVLTNYLEIWNFEDPYGGYYGDGYIGYLHAGNSLGAGSYYLNITGDYTPWAPPQELTTIPDGVYSIDYTALAPNGEVIGDWVGPIFVKSTTPDISGEVTEDKITGQVTDDYLHYIDVLAEWGYSYDLNEKLSASYKFITDGAESEVDFLTLEQDGSFEIELNQEADSVIVIVEDAAGNIGEVEIAIEQGDEDPEPVVSLSVNPESVELEEGEEASVVVTQTTTIGDESTEEDVTALAEYEVADESIVSIEAGVITGIKAGETTVKITYGENEVALDVIVTEGDSEPDPDAEVSLEVSDPVVLVNKGETKQVTVTELTTIDGETTERDVTAEANYTVADDRIVEVHEGVISGKNRGITVITVEYGENTVEITVAVADSSGPRHRLP